MSYDVWLVIDTGGPQPVEVTVGRNMTSNVGPMWRLAGADLAEFHGRIAGDVLPLLDAAITDMRSNPAKYRALNPANGWGNYERCLDFLRGLRADFENHPRAIVQVSR